MKSLLAACLALTASAAFAQEGRLAGTLLKVQTTGTVTLAYREAAIPFSFLARPGEPVGYSIELCRRLVEEMAVAVGRELQVRYLPVTARTREEAIISGKADLECGSTTSNSDRARRVAFSPHVFISGTRLAVKREHPVASFRDLRDKTIAFAAGASNEQALRDLSKRTGVRFRLMPFPTLEQAFAQMLAGKADAFASDDVLLHGLIAKGGLRGKYVVVDERHSYEPYAIMFRKGDEGLAALVDGAFRALARNGEIVRQYQRWFLQDLPFGASLEMPMSPQLEAHIRTLAQRGN
jgi:glutamate/aspartate transport system substrate-binding protein